MSSPRQASIDAWEQRYAPPDYVFGTAPSQFVLQHARLLQPGMKVLAVADGEGRNGVWLAGQGLDVHAIDASARALEKAQALAAQRGVALRTEQVDVMSWAWPEQAYDAVVAVFIQFASATDRPLLFQRMQQALKPGGLLLLHGYTPKQLEYGTGGPSCVDQLYTEALLREAFAGWPIERLQAYEAELSEGRGHAGRSALIDLIARRPA